MSHSEQVVVTHRSALTAALRSVREYEVPPKAPERVREVGADPSCVRFLMRQSGVVIDLYRPSADPQAEPGLTLRINRLLGGAQEFPEEGAQLEPALDIEFTLSGGEFSEWEFPRVLVERTGPPNDSYEGLLTRALGGPVGAYLAPESGPEPGRHSAEVNVSPADIQYAITNLPGRLAAMAISGLH